MEPTFTFDSELHLWNGKGASWIFARLPEDESEEIRDIVPRKAGFGSVRVRMTLGECEWMTSLFPDSKSGCYIVFIKAPIRKAAGVDVGDDVELQATLVLD